jgi:phage terminase small subunit
MHPAYLTAKQARFIDEFLVDSNGTAAAIRAGYAPGSAKVAASRMMSKDNPVRRAIHARQDADSERLGVFRDRVVNGLMEAINLAREQHNPMAMIRGWAEIGKMMGFYAPETKRVELSAAGVGAMGRLAQMTDAELLALISQGAN